MENIKDIKAIFQNQRAKLFEDKELVKDSYKFCVQYSLLVEEFIFKIASGIAAGCAIASGGSFSRRELSPHSDIDIMFIFPELDGSESTIQNCITNLWDAGIEVSHTVRTYSDIKKFLKDDLHSFTQFFETRFILGEEKVYKEWNNILFESIDEESKKNLIDEFIDDIAQRHARYGDSAKMLEPNVKYTCGGLRDLHVIEWMFSLKNCLLLTESREIAQTKSFLKSLQRSDVINRYVRNDVIDSYAFVLSVRNHLHLFTDTKNDRLEFRSQEKIAGYFGYDKTNWQNFMKRYFEAANNINRFSKTMVKKFRDEITDPISDYLAIDLDDDYSMKGNVITLKNKGNLSLSEIFRAFYYRGLKDARFDQKLRWKILESIQDYEEEDRSSQEVSSVFFREILRLPKNVGKTLSMMNEMGVMGAFMPEFKEMIGFFQPGVYHCYTSDEHTLIALNNIEKLREQDSNASKIFAGIKNKDILYLAVIFHDIAKPINVSGHEIIGAEIANSVMERLNYDQEEIALVKFLVRHHLTMEQVAFRRNLNDPAALNNFVVHFSSLQELEMLYILTYADLSAVSPAVWTHWKSDLLAELFRKSKYMIEDRISGEELLHATTADVIVQGASENNSFQEHIESINDLGYAQHYSEDEINLHINEIEKGSKISVFFKEGTGFTNITIISVDAPSLLSRLCGALSINDLNIHSAQIFTRDDGIVIDSFSVTDFRTHKPIEPSRYESIELSLMNTLDEERQIIKEFNKAKSKWWRLESKLFKRKGKVKIEFEKHEKYTIIDVFSPDRLGLLFTITKKMNELGLVIHLAKISTKADDVVDAFYTLYRDGKKVSPKDYELIRVELTSVIEELL
ncbi:MAG: HD domain-containing protein [Ignavibacteriae bacterium]|nr:HD domain-containing protein [Ignavibacteriota bacterium]NOG98160.1 HD domain-containing protein [Ignavibacteriota bacterium]